MESQTLSRGRFGAARRGRTGRRGGSEGGARRGDGDAGLLSRSRHTALHQRLRHLHRDDGIADAARGDGRDRLRLQALRDARGAAAEGRRADRQPGARRGGNGDVRRRVGADARHRRGADRNRSAQDGVAAGPHRHEERSHHPEGASLRLRPCRPQLRRPHGGGRDARGSRARGQRQDRDDDLLQQQQQGRAHPGRRVRPAREEAFDSDDE